MIKEISGGVLPRNLTAAIQKRAKKLKKRKTAARRISADGKYAMSPC